MSPFPLRCFESDFFFFDYVIFTLLILLHLVLKNRRGCLPLCMKIEMKVKPLASDYHDYSFCYLKTGLVQFKQCMLFFGQFVFERFNGKSIAKLQWNTLPKLKDLWKKG